MMMFLLSVHRVSRCLWGSRLVVYRHSRLRGDVGDDRRDVCPQGTLYPPDCRHSLLVTSMGCVYSAGEGIDGALGHGGQESSADFRLVEW